MRSRPYISTRGMAKVRGVLRQPETVEIARRIEAAQLEVVEECVAAEARDRHAGRVAQRVVQALRALRGHLIFGHDRDRLRRLEQRRVGLGAGGALPCEIADDRTVGLFAGALIARRGRGRRGGRAWRCAARVRTGRRAARCCLGACTRMVGKSEDCAAEPCAVAGTLCPARSSKEVPNAAVAAPTKRKSIAKGPRIPKSGGAERGVSGLTKSKIGRGPPLRSPKIPLSNS